jgi:signal peptidase I
MKPQGVKRYLMGAAALALTVATWLFFAPQRLGGPVSYLVVSGSSMEPMLSRGDLVLVRDSDDYRERDVVAYRSHDLGRIVVHRLVGQHAGHFVLKGDNNDWLDADRPASSDLVGKLWLRVPRAGRLLVRLREPRSTAPFLGGLAAIGLGFGVGRGRGHQGPSRKRDSPRSDARGSGRRELA